MDECLKNKSEVLKQLFLQYSKLMFHVAYEILHDHFLAEDAVESAFVKLTKNNFIIDEISSNKTRAFMIIISKNTAIEIYNKRNKTDLQYYDNEPMEVKDDHLLPLDIIINQETLSEIKKAISLLDSKYSDIITIKYFYNYSDAEISALLGISQELVRVRLHRARKALKSMILKAKEGGSQYE
jgi:RNA polymerase sigma factor, sigma-70 family